MWSAALLLQMSLGTAAAPDGAVLDVSPSAAQNAQPSCKAAVLDLQVQGGIAPSHVAALTDVIATQVRGAIVCSVLSRTDIRALMSFEEEKQLAGCTSNSCVAEIGDALGVDRLIIGSIGRIDDRVVISIKMVDMKNLAVLQSVTDSYIGDDASAVPFTQWLARRLVLGDDAAGPKPNVDSRMVMERQMSWWRVLSLTSLGLGATSAVASLGTGLGAWGIERALPTQKTARDSNRKEITDLEHLGPTLAGTSNLTLYIAAGFVVVGAGLFFLPADTLVEVTP